MNIAEALLFLENLGWSELIDSRWTIKVKNDLLKYNPKLSNEEINYILNIVIYPKPNFNENENVKENN